MDNFFDTVKNQQDPFKKLMSYIPGFNGYVERQTRRDADKLLRDRNSRAEFTVAKDQNVKLKSGWFSERSASYLSAGRPVITEDTGFGSYLPTGEGLFAFETMDQAIAHIETIEADLDRHRRAARRIAEDHFESAKVLGQMLRTLDLA